MFENYLREMDALGAAVMRCMALSLQQQEHFFEPFYDRPFWIMRSIGYPARAQRTEDGDGCGEHTDYGCLTMVNQDDHFKGVLQVKNKAGDWINADPIPGSCVMNIGDMIEHWTCGLYKSTPHRVCSPTRGYRVSVPFFFEPNYDAVVDPRDLVLDPALFKGAAPPAQPSPPIKYCDHLLRKTTSNFVDV
jgi:isopenicillin N synthase-like dioxygenase